jgi:hypothetical protein
MNTHQLYSENNSPNSFQVLGDLSLEIGSLTSYSIETWLLESLAPLHLNKNFVNKVLDSCHETLERVVKAADEKNIDCIYLMIFAPQNHTLTGQTWGFFCIEKKRSLASELVIELYLYPEVEN